MLESRARQWIAALPSLSATDWYEHLLIRRGALPPELLPLLGWLKSLGGSPPPAPHLAALQAALRLQDLPQPPDAGGRPLPWAEAPWLQVRRVAAAVLAGHGDWTPPPGLAAVAGLAGVAEAAAIDDPHGAALGHGHPAQHDILPDWTPAQAAYIAQSATWAAAWLQAAAALGPGHQPPFGNWLPPAVLASVQLPVARLDEWDQGLPASLTLFRLHQPGAGLCLAPAPASAALLRCGTAWDAALADLRQQITALLGPAAAPLLRDTAIAWDLAGVGDSPLGIVSGPSLSAAMALGTLWLLREAVPPPLQANLARLDGRHLATAAVTAALGPQPELELLPVDGTLGKAAALQALATAMARYPQHPDAGTLVLHVSQHQAQPVAAVVTGSVPGQVPHRGSPTLGALVQHLAEMADPLSPDQTTLLQSLLAPGDQAPHLADDGLLQRVYGAPVHTLRHYLLHAWATHERLLGGQVHQRFVPLAVRPDAAGFAYPQLLDGLHGDFDDGVRQVLGKLDGSGVQAYLLRGAPGAGKSTLLRHHLQHSARHALRALSLPAAALSPQDGPPELPLVLSLNGLAPGADPATWLQQQLAAHPPALAALLCDQGDWAQQGLRARVMLDGLNELQVAHADQRPARAQQVVQAVQALRQAHKPRGEPLPLLLSIREHHASRLTDLLVLPVDVKPWEVAQIQRYLALRFALDGDQGLRRLRALQAMPDALALCRRPMYLALLCDLLEDGFGAAQGDSAALPGNRAALYAAWLWGALRRALNGNPRHRAHDDPALWDEAPGAGADAVLLTAADRAAILSDSAWRAGRLHQLPQQGQLLRCLMQQAEDQWWAGAGAADSRAEPAVDAEPEAERSAAPVPWASVAKGLPEPLRQRLGHAAATLGVATLDEGFSTWRFAHQSWAEYLASCRLLRAGVPLSPQLLGRLHAVPPPFDSDEAQVQALAGGGPAWREVPQALWDRLLKEGLQVDLAAFANAGLDAASRSRDLQTKLDWLRTRGHPALFLGQVLRFDAARQQCCADLGRWAATEALDDALGLPPGGWLTRPAAGWQFLVQQRLIPVFQDAFWAWLAQRAQEGCLDPALPKRLRADEARLALPPAPDGGEVLGLALQGLDDAALADALQALLVADEARTLWPALAGVLPVLLPRLEPQGAWGERAVAGRPLAPAGPHARRLGALLQHLRRVLLLTCLDAGAHSGAPVRASGQLALLDAAEPPGLPAELRRCWRRQRARAFQGAGQRLALRLQAGLLLGQLGDNLRFERVQRSAAVGDWGLRPRRALWAPVGDVEEHSYHAIGSPAGEGYRDEHPSWQVQLAGFEACRLPLTVGEWRCFWRTPAGQAHAWALADDPDRNNPLQPVTGISWHAMQAYAAWADALYADWQAAEAKQGLRPLQLALPTELHWEAAARAPAAAPTLRDSLAEGWQRLRGRPARPLAAGADAGTGTGALEGPASDIAFNHANTRWLRPSPVGCFSRAYSPRGLADVRGNVWEFCSNVLSLAQRDRGWDSAADRQRAGQPAPADNDDDRALRGGAFIYTASQCRPSCRYRIHTGAHAPSIGVRLVRVWPPQS